MKCQAYPLECFNDRNGWINKIDDDYDEGLFIQRCYFLIFVAKSLWCTKNNELVVRTGLEISHTANAAPRLFNAISVNDA